MSFHIVSGIEYEDTCIVNFQNISRIKLEREEYPKGKYNNVVCFEMGDDWCSFDTDLETLREVSICISNPKNSCVSFTKARIEEIYKENPYYKDLSEGEKCV